MAPVLDSLTNVMTTRSVSKSASWTHASEAALPSHLYELGILLALSSSAFIGASFILQKKGILQSQASKRVGRRTSASCITPTLQSGRDGRIDSAELPSAQPKSVACETVCRDLASPTEFLQFSLREAIIKESQTGLLSGTDHEAEAMSRRRVTAPATVEGSLHDREHGDQDARPAGIVRFRRASTARAGPPTYLSSRCWWLGTLLRTFFPQYLNSEIGCLQCGLLVLIGETANLGAYAFTSAMVVTPLGALSVVVSAILSTCFLKEHMNLQGKLGCALCLIGATILVLNAPKQTSAASISEFQASYLSIRFIPWNLFAMGGAAFLALIMGTRPVARRNPLVYIGVCSLLGALSVVEIQAVGSAIVGASYDTSPHAMGLVMGSPLFWVILVKAVCEQVLQLYFLNKALAVFSTVLVTPMYYVTFTSSTLISNWILTPPWESLDGRIASTCALAFSVICSGVILLQTSKVSTTITCTGGPTSAAAAITSIGSVSQANGPSIQAWSTSELRASSSTLNLALPAKGSSYGLGGDTDLCQRDQATSSKLQILQEPEPHYPANPTTVVHVLQSPLMLEYAHPAFTALVHAMLRDMESPTTSSPSSTDGGDANDALVPEVFPHARSCSLPARFASTTTRLPDVAADHQSNSSESLHAKVPIEHTGLVARAAGMAAIHLSAAKALSKMANKWLSPWRTKCPTPSAQCPAQDVQPNPPGSPEAAFASRLWLQTSRLAPSTALAGVTSPNMSSMAGWNEECDGYMA